MLVAKGYLSSSLSLNQSITTSKADFSPDWPDSLPVPAAATCRANQSLSGSCHNTRKFLSSIQVSPAAVNLRPAKFSAPCNSVSLLSTQVCLLQSPHCPVLCRHPFIELPCVTMVISTVSWLSHEWSRLFLLPSSSSRCLSRGARFRHTRILLTSSYIC